MKRSAILLALLLASTLSATFAQTAPPLRIFLRGGPKTHGPAGNGQHDGPTFVKEWQPLLASRGAKVDGGLTFPTAAQLDNTDVLVIFSSNGGTILGDDRVNLEKFLRRGGGIVCLHACVVAEDPQWFKTMVGGAWENGVARYFEGESTHYYVSNAHPITKGASNFTITDEVYWNLHITADAQILAAAMQPVRPPRGSTVPPPAPAIGTLIPQLWVYSNQLDGGQPYRAVVSLLGHHFSTFSSPHVRALFLRSIAWAAKRDADLLATPDEIAALK